MKAFGEAHLLTFGPAEVVRDDDLRSIFKPFGEFDDFLMGNGECWITFKNHNDAQVGLEKLFWAVEVPVLAAFPFVFRIANFSG